MPAKILGAARAMAWHLWPALAPGDALLVAQDPPPGFREYLSGLGIVPPRFFPEDGTLSASGISGASEASGVPDLPGDSSASPLHPLHFPFRFTPFGWNAEAVQRRAAGDFPAAHPEPEVVRRVNSRAFSLELEHALFPGEACPAVFCAHPGAVDAWMAQARPGRYVAKGNHGHAGIGQLRFVIPAVAPVVTASPALTGTLKRLLARHGGLVLEEEQEVEREWGLLFRIGRDGDLSEFRRHRLLSGVAGGYDGALITPGAEPEWLRVEKQAEHAAERIAAALHESGYFGPVGIDVYLYRHKGEIRLRPLADLNARLSMAYPAHGLAARFPRRTVLVRQMPASLLCVPDGYDALRRERDILSFDSRAQQGFIWLTPLLPLPRHSLAYLGESEKDVTQLQNQVQKMLQIPLKKPLESHGAIGFPASKAGTPGNVLSDSSGNP